MVSSIEYSCGLLNEKYKDILEFGVYQGTTIRKIVDCVNGFRIFGFDTFEGLPEDWKGTVCDKGFFSTNGLIPDIKGVHFFKGLFSDTLKEYLLDPKDISLLHIDCDLYSSTKDVLYGLNEYIKEGTIICFDEWLYCGIDGTMKNDCEQKCFYEWVSDFDRSFEFVDFVDNTACGHERKIVRIIK